MRDISYNRLCRPTERYGSRTPSPKESGMRHIYIYMLYSSREARACREEVVQSPAIESPYAFSTHAAVPVGNRLVMHVFYAYMVREGPPSSTMKVRHLLRSSSAASSPIISCRWWIYSAYGIWSVGSRLLVDDAYGACGAYGLMVYGRWALASGLVDEIARQSSRGRMHVLYARMQ